MEQKSYLKPSSHCQKAMATYSNALAWKIPWTEEPGRLQFMRSWRVRHDWATSLSLSFIREGSGNPLQCSCLKNPRDGRAWWAAICGVAQSQTWLKWLSSRSSHCQTFLHYQPHVCLVAQSCLTLWNPMECSLPGSSVLGNSPNQNTGVGCHALLQGIFPSQESNPGLPHCRRILYQLSYSESPYVKNKWLATHTIWQRKSSYRFIHHHIRTQRR